MTPVPRRVPDVENDPAIVVTPDGATGNLDEWLASLRHDGPPTDLGISAAELVAEARRDYE